MARRPFNPDEARGGLFNQPENAPTHAKSETPQALTPSLLNKRIKQTLENNIGESLLLEGELTSFVNRGHWYFSVKDDTAAIGCVMWRSDADRCGFEPVNGEAILLRGRVSYYTRDGRTQFYATAMKQKGLGSLEERFQALCLELRNEGYFDADHKKRLPSFPRRIAVVTSASGAAVEDIRQTAMQRFPGVAILVVDVRVQGDGSAADVARAIGVLDTHAEQLGLDAIVVTRGGGSREDLWAFNERVVAEATYQCRTPILAAIGHEVDTSIIELVADERAATPTQAAVRLVPERRELTAQLDYQADRLGQLMVRAHATHGERIARAPRELQRVMQLRLQQQRRRLLEMERRLAANKPTARLATMATRLAGMEQRLPAALHSRLERCRSGLATNLQRLPAVVTARVVASRQRFEATARHLSSVGPRAVMARGYTIALDDNGCVIRRAADGQIGDTLSLRFLDGELQTTIQARKRAAEAGEKDAEDVESSP